MGKILPDVGVARKGSPPDAADGDARGPIPVITIGVIVALLILIGCIGMIVALVIPGASVTFGVIRDVAITIMALSFLLDALALVLLLYQLNVLVNLVRNEVGPILEAAQDTAGTVSGTSKFVGRHLVEPIIKVSAFVAGLTKLVVGMFDILRRLMKRRSSDSWER